MATLSKSSTQSFAWSPAAHALATQAQVLSGNKLEQLVVRLQRHSGRSKEACWRFVIRYGLKRRKDYRRWSEIEVETVREELVKRSVDEVAKKIERTPKAVRNMIKRNGLSLREIRCDLFSVESLASALHVRKAEVLFWIEQNWLQATIGVQGKRRSYSITPEALKDLHKHHHGDLMKRGLRNQTLFEAYVEYCFAPKHTVGEQILDVRRDKRERTAFAVARSGNPSRDDEEHGYDDDEGDTYCVETDAIEDASRTWNGQEE
jgi:hypothetical protein